MCPSPSQSGHASPDTHPASLEQPVKSDSPVPIALPAEINVQIISHLRRPLPSPTRYGWNDPSSIRQPDLAVLMRTSKLLNELAALPLYSTVVTDNLQLFTHNLNRYSPSAKGIRSKAALVAYTRRLFLEYNHVLAPTYLQVMQKGRQAYLQIDPDRLGKATFCRAEAMNIAHAAKLLSFHASLISVSSAIFLGGPIYNYQVLYKDPPIADLHDRVNEAAVAVSQLYIEPHPSHMCGRAVPGPLMLLSTTQPPANFTQSHCVHFDTDSNPRLVPALMGGHTDVHFSFPGGDPGIEQGMPVLVRVAYHQLKDREEARKDLCAEHRPHRSEDKTLSVDFYVPASWTSSEYWRFAHKELAHRIKLARGEFGVPESSYPRDSFQLKKLEDAPACTCCGWSPKDI